ncbi:MAG: UDP-3-O-(3-hydroxymyristoyl)glucosamine N-acyltransferase [Gammaproteobacteria bacterium]|nr:MAG: UDP-3-O-(3-hydroxymyristoyl)glucosamine N-acyltransferase [Gammaproteobacteria bacterium]
MWTLAEIAEKIGGLPYGDAAYTVESVGTLIAAKPEQLSFLSNSKYKKYLAETKAGIVIVHHSMISHVPNNAIAVDDPYVAYAKAASFLHRDKVVTQGIHPSASIDDSSHLDSSVSIAAQVVISAGVTLEKDVVIGPGCVLLEDVYIAARTRLVANVTVCSDVKIGQRVIIHPGVVIGADGFGIANDKGKWIKVPQLGAVTIGNDVEIGANTTIDRGAINDTIIADGVKLDNQIQIGHNVIIGENTVVAGCVGIAGSTTIGKNCLIGGGVGISGHLELAEGVQLTGMTMVTKSLTKSGAYSSGIPAESTQQWHRNVVRYRQMDKMAERIKALESK